MQNLLNENEFDLYENESVCETRFRITGFVETRFDTEAKCISEMAYWLEQFSTECRK